MSNYPVSLDDDVTLPPVNNNITEIGDEAINACRESIFNMQTEFGLGLSGSAGTLADRLGVSIGADGYIKPSALTSLGLVTLPITNPQIANNAGIPESKLTLDHRTADLFNYTRELAGNINVATSWISLTGIKLEPHILGITYKHPLSGISVSESATDYFLSRYRTYRDNTDSYTVLNELNSEVINHQWSDGSGTSTSSITTNDGSTYPADYAHTSAGIYLDTTRFSVIPQTTTDLQLFAQHLDDASIFLYGTRIQNLYSNGISRASRSAVLTASAQGRTVVPSTMVTTYLRNNGSSSSPVDDIENGDDIIEFTPDSSVTSNFLFDSQFALAKVGDIIRVNYGSIEVPFLIKEKKYMPGTPGRFFVRISSNNLYYTTDGYAKIEKPLYHNNKYGVLAVAPSNCESISVPASLIVTNPTGAMALGVGFNADLIDSTHYNLWLALYTTGNPDDGYIVLPPIDVTGDQGKSPGKYTLETIVQTVNDAFRKPGYNYRFIAFSYQGEFGIALADPYSNAAFSILDGVVDSLGDYDQTETEGEYINNVIGLFGSGTLEPVDPLGLGPLNGGISSPAYSTSYVSSAQSLYPAKLYTPLDRNNFYVNGTERDKLTLESGQTQDGYGFGYWGGFIVPGSRNETPGTRVSVTYRILDNVLASVNIRPGSTIVVQPTTVTDYVNLGRFIVTDVSFIECGTDCYTDITVYDAVHGIGTSPYTSAETGNFKIYFNSGSVSVNAENSSDYTEASPFKRLLEIYIDEDSKTFVHERGRFTNSGSDITVNSVDLRTTSELSKMELIDISPKLRGYQFSSVNKISLFIDTLNSVQGTVDGYLASYDGTNLTHMGPTTTGRFGQVLRFYDETNVDYIDVLFPTDVSLSSITDEIVDIQLFPSLSSDKEIMKLATCQYNTVTNYINYLTDKRQFGNVSEDELSTSALDYISLPDKMLHQNGVLKGFDAQDVTPISNPNSGQIYLSGGWALVGGKLIFMNNETVSIPIIKEDYLSTLYNINWILCVSNSGEFQAIPSLDYDFGTPSSTRNFKAYNPATTATYYIEAIKFSDLINNRKDLTPLYIVSSIVSGSTISLTLHDVRKFANDGDNNNTLICNNYSNRGNFRSAESIFNWLKFDSTYSHDVVMSGVTETITSGITIDTLGTVTIDGQNNSALTFNQQFTINSNVVFKEMELTFSNDLNINSSIVFKGLDITFEKKLEIENASDVTFEDCTINFSGTGYTSNIYILDSSNVTFKNCTIVADYSGSAAANGGRVFYTDGINGFNFIDSSVNVTFSISSSYYPGNIFDFTDASATNSSSKIKIENSEFSGNFRRCMSINTNSFGLNDFEVRGCTITCTYNAVDNIGGFTSEDLVNNGNGYIYFYSTFGNYYNNIIMDDVEFNSSPSSSSDGYRFSFINFNTDYSSVIENVSITRCRFNNTVVSGEIDDFRAVIAIVNRNTSSTEQPPPTVRNLEISNNICDRNQMIVMTSTSYTTANNVKAMRPTYLAAQNCVIKDNICGAIGYWIGEGRRADNYSPNVTRENNKEFGLTIYGNTCNIITNLDHEGLAYSIAEYSSVQAKQINTCTYTSSFVHIEGNRSSWIIVSVADYIGSKFVREFPKRGVVNIVNNMLSATSLEYVSPYSTGTDFDEKTYYAIHVDGLVYDDYAFST